MHRARELCYTKIELPENSTDQQTDINTAIKLTKVQLSNWQKYNYQTDKSTPVGFCIWYFCYVPLILTLIDLGSFYFYLLNTVLHDIVYLTNGTKERVR